MQRDIVVVILYDSIYNQYKIVKMQNCKYRKLLVLGTISSLFVVLNTDNLRYLQFTFLQFYTGYRYCRME
jgi:hypothetical protein